MSLAGPIEAGISALEHTSAYPASSKLMFLHAIWCACRLLSFSRVPGTQAETRGDLRDLLHNISRFESGLLLSTFSYTL